MQSFFFDQNIRDSEIQKCGDLFCFLLPFVIEINDLLPVFGQRVHAFNAVGSQDLLAVPD